MNHRVFAFTYLLIQAWACAGHTGRTPRGEGYDLLITGGTVVDGSGGRRFVADVAVQGDRIVRVGRYTSRPRVDGDE